MQGPIDPQHPGQDAGAQQPEAQDGDLHALLERLLGQGDVRPSAPGAGDDLWPDLLAAQTDEVSTIVPAPDAPTAVADPPDTGESMAAIAEPDRAHAWEPVVVDAASASTNVDDIHAAILASVSIDLQPVAPAEPSRQADREPEAIDVAAVDVPVDAPANENAVADVAVDTASETTELPPAAIDLDPAEPADGFVLTPFEATLIDGADDLHPDAEALWAAAVPELGLDVAPLLDLDPVDVDPADVDPADIDSADEQGPVTAIVLPWPSHEPTPVEPAAPTAHDLIEAALSGLHADLTAEPIEPLRTPDVAVSTAHVVFHLGGRTMAIPLAAVSEIARPPKVTRLPHVPAWVLGIANLRGDIVSMVDLEGFFSGKAGRSSHEQRMLALRPAGDEVRTAVLVDSVDGIQAFEDARIARVTRGYDAEVAPYARGLYQVEDDLVVVLDADRLLQSKPMRQFEDGAGAR